MSESRPTLAELFRVALEANRRDLHTSIPAVVVKVNRSGDKLQSVDVQPSIKASYVDQEGNRRVEALPVIPNCPVGFPAGGGMAVTLPVRKGDSGWLLFSEASIDKWFATGQHLDPGDDRRHHLSDGMFLPGARASAFVAPTDRMRLGSEEGSAVIEITSTEIQAGGTTPLATAPGPIVITCTGGTVTHNLGRTTVLKGG